MASPCIKTALHGKIATLLKSTRSEDLVAAVVLLEKAFQMPCDCEHTTSEQAVLQAAGSRISPVLILSLIQSNTNVLLQGAGLFFLTQCLQGNTSERWLTHAEQLVDTAFTITETTKQHQMHVILKALSAQGVRDRVLSSLLLHPALARWPAPTDMLSLLTDLASTGDPIDLQDDGALRLQALLIACLHGSAPKHQRDSTLTSLCDLLDSTISPRWTIVRPPGASAMEGCLPCLLVSVVSVELHLLTEELLDNPTKLSAWQMLSVCCQLIQRFLSLLVEDTSTGPVWTSTSLPFEAILALQRHLSSCQQQVVDFLSDLAALSNLQLTAGNSVCSAIDMAVALAREDADLRAMLLSKLPAVLRLVPLLPGGADELLGYLWSLSEELLAGDAAQKQGELLDQLLAVCKPITAIVTAAFSQAASSGRQAGVCFLTNLLSLQAASLRALLPSEGVHAFPQLLQSTAEDWRALHSALMQAASRTDEVEDREQMLRLAEEIQALTVLELLSAV